MIRRKIIVIDYPTKIRPDISMFRDYYGDFEQGKSGRVALKSDFFFIFALFQESRLNG